MTEDADIYRVVAHLRQHENAFDCVAINLPYGLHVHLGRPLEYFTFLREPVERCISYWYFAYENRDSHPLWSTIEKYRFDLEAIIENRAVYQFSNDQTRMVTGSNAAEPRETEFEMACETLKKRYSYVGNTQHFDVGLKIVADHLGWRSREYSRQNVTAKTETSILPVDAVNVFRSANRWDIKLYEWSIQERLHLLPWRSSEPGTDHAKAWP
jgi:hypothetical protein